MDKVFAATFKNTNPSPTQIFMLVFSNDVWYFPGTSVCLSKSRFFYCVSYKLYALWWDPKRTCFLPHTYSLASRLVTPYYILSTWSWNCSHIPLYFHEFVASLFQQKFPSLSTPLGWFLQYTQTYSICVKSSWIFWVMIPLSVYLGLFSQSNVLTYFIFRAIFIKYWHCLDPYSCEHLIR